MTRHRKILLTLLLPLLLGACTEGCRPSAQAEAPLYDDGEAALRDGRTDQARALIEQGKRTARDSSEYYRYVVLQSKLYFSTMQTDSFLLCNQQLAAFLDRHRDGDARQRQMLTAEYEMQRGVYAAKMTGQMDSALVHYQRALSLIDPADDPHGNRLVTLSNMADAYKQAGQYDKSVDYFHQALTLGDSLGMSTAMAATLDIGIASTYAAMGSFDQSAEWWARAEQLLPWMQPTEQFHYWNNRGNDYYLQGQYEASLDCFLHLDSLLAQHPDMQWERMFGWANLSDVYVKLHQPQKALPLLEETEAFFTRQGLPVVLYYLATLRIEMAMLDGRTDEALRLAAADSLTERMIPEQKLLRLKVLTRLYEQAGQWQQSAAALKGYTQLHDSIASDQMKMRFSSMLMGYEHEKEILEKQREVEDHKYRFYWAATLSLLLLLAMALIVVISILRRRERKLKEQAMLSRIASLRMETVRNRITPHFIGNALSAEMLAQLNGQPVDLNPLVQLLHRGIEMTGNEQITLADELEFIRFYCNIESRSVGSDFRFDVELAPGVDATQVRLPSMTIQILVENAIKHGLKGKPVREGHYRSVLVKATRQREGTLVEVIDNGVGMAKDSAPVERTGLMVLRKTLQLLNEQNRQQMEYRVENYRHPSGDTGCRAWIYLPDDYEYTLNQT